MSHLLLLPFGSAGDVFPFIWLGRHLLARGHRVTMITACLFEKQARAAGLEFVPLGRAGDFEDLIRDPRLWQAGRGSRLVFDFAAASTESYLAAIEGCGPADLMLAPMTAFGARLAREKHGIPLITVHLQPKVLTPELEAFLTAGARPVVFTPGSANVHAERFFEVAAEAVRRCNCRAVFVTRESDQVPHNLPDDILTVAYAPFGILLEQALVLVHHGGIGTLAQGLAAGVPQLVMAMAHDQPDNAARLVGLGAGLSLSARWFTPDRVTRDLQRLLHDDSFSIAARKCAGKIGTGGSADHLMEWIGRRLSPGQ